MKGLEEASKRVNLGFVGRALTAVADALETEEPACRGAAGKLMGYCEAEQEEWRGRTKHQRCCKGGIHRPS